MRIPGKYETRRGGGILMRTTGRNDANMHIRSITSKSRSCPRHTPYSLPMAQEQYGLRFTGSDVQATIRQAVYGCADWAASPGDGGDCQRRAIGSTAGRSTHGKTRAIMTRLCGRVPSADLLCRLTSWGTKQPAEQASTFSIMACVMERLKLIIRDTKWSGEWEAVIEVTTNWGSPVSR